MTNPVTPPDVSPSVTAPAPSEGLAESELMMRAEEVTRDAWTWLQEHVLTPENLIAISVQLGVIVAALLLGRIFAPRVRKLIDRGISKLPEQVREKAEQIAPLILDHGLRPAIWIAFLWIGQTALQGLGQPYLLVRIAASLAR